jgi:hypothetical protein
MRHAPCGAGDGQHVGFKECVHITAKLGPASREMLAGNAKKPGKETAFLEELFAFGGRERWQHERVTYNRRVNERRIDPAQCCNAVGIKGRASRKRTRRTRQCASDPCMQPVQHARCLEALLKRAEHQRENELECAMKTPNRMRKRVRVLFDRGGNPWMRKLEQKCAACAEKIGGFAVDAPAYRRCTENAFDLARSSRTQPFELAFKTLRRDDFEGVVLEQLPRTRSATSRS